MSIIHQSGSAHSPKVKQFSYDYYTDKFAKEAKKQISIIHVYAFAEEMSAMMSGRSAATMSEKFAATVAVKYKRSVTIYIVTCITSKMYHATEMSEFVRMFGARIQRERNLMTQ